MNLKNNYLLKQLLLSKPIKNVILHLYPKNLDDMVYSSWDIEWQIEVDYYGSFFALLPMYASWDILFCPDVCFLRYGAQQT